MKRIPSFASLPPNEESFRTVLGWIGDGIVTEEFESLIHQNLHRTMRGGSDMRRSLCKWEFLEKDGSNLILKGFSSDFLEKRKNFSNLIYAMLVKARFEMIRFLEELIDLLKENRTMSRADLLDWFIDAVYSAHTDRIKKSSALRNLTEILKFAEFAEIISTDDSGSIELGPRSDSYLLDSSEKDFFNRLRRVIHKYGSKKVLTDYELLTLHRLSLRARAKGRRFGLEQQMQKAEKILNSEKFKNNVEEYKSGKRRSRRQRIKEAKESLFKLQPDMKLYDWQSRCLDTWRDNGYRGVIKVVTGAGKTILALAAIEDLRKQYPNLLVSVVVPTKALMYQWKASISTNLQVRNDDIGLYGDGHREGFSGSRSIVVFIYNSAVLNDNLKRNAEDSDDCPHILIVDEVHRSGSPEFRRVFNTPRDFVLGLSATPDKPTDTTFQEIIEPSIGGVIFSYGFEEARKDGVIPPFEINNVAVDLNDDERRRYDELTEQIGKIVRRLKARYHERLWRVSENLFEATLRRIQKELETPDRDISSYFIKTSRRKRNLYDAVNRWSCVEGLLKRHKDSRIIMFHESIVAVDWEIYSRTSLRNKRILIYHSGNPSRDNKLSLELYRRGVAKILVSVKALVEGLDVPESDIGIIVASSSSPTQRIQTMGRILRTGKSEGKFSRLYVIYTRDTTDERIFGRISWDEIANPDSIHHKLWSDGELNPHRAPQIPTRLLSPEDIDTSQLDIGDVYPGVFTGMKLSSDHRGLVFVKSRRGRRTYLGDEWNKLGRDILREKPSGGVFRINECGHVLVKGIREGKLRTIYFGSVEPSKLEAIDDG